MEIPSWSDIRLREMRVVSIVSVWGGTSPQNNGETHMNETQGEGKDRGTLADTMIETGKFYSEGGSRRKKKRMGWDLLYSQVQCRCLSDVFCGSLVF